MSANAFDNHHSRTLARAHDKNPRLRATSHREVRVNTCPNRPLSLPRSAEIDVSVFMNCPLTSQGWEPFRSGPEGRTALSPELFAAHPFGDWFGLFYFWEDAPDASLECAGFSRISVPLKTEPGSVSSHVVVFPSGETTKL